MIYFKSISFEETFSTLSNVQDRLIYLFFMDSFDFIVLKFESGECMLFCSNLADPTAWRYAQVSNEAPPKASRHAHNTWSGVNAQTSQFSIHLSTAH